MYTLICDHTIAGLGLATGTYAMDIDTFTGERSDYQIIYSNACRRVY